MDVCFVIQQRLKELGLEQRDLAAAAQVTESYISQLLTRKKTPPAADRTDLYDKMNAFLKLPKGQLSALVRAQRREELKEKLSDSPAPLFQEVRDLILRKCAPGKQPLVRDIFEKQAFGELERLVTQKLLDVTKSTIRTELKKESWLRSLAKLQHRVYEDTRAMTLEFLNTDMFDLSMQHCSAFLEPVIKSWDIDLKTFGIEIILNKGMAARAVRRTRICRNRRCRKLRTNPGFQGVLAYCGIERRCEQGRTRLPREPPLQAASPSPLYFYRELQSLRDALHFPEDSSSGMQNRNFHGSDSPAQVQSRKRTIRPWVRNTSQDLAKTNRS